MLLLTSNSACIKRNHTMRPMLGMLIPQILEKGASVGWVLVVSLSSYRLCTQSP